MLGFSSALFAYLLNPISHIFLQSKDQSPSFNNSHPLLQKTRLYEIAFLYCAACLQFHLKDRLLYEYVSHVYIKIKISPSVPLHLLPFLTLSVSPLSCSNIVFLFILSLGKYLPWATEAGWIWMGIISACQISCRSLPANVSVIGKTVQPVRLLPWHGRHVLPPVSGGWDATPQPRRSP